MLVGYMDGKYSLDLHAYSYIYKRIAKTPV